MNNVPVRYEDIPKAERRRLATEVYRSSRSLKVITLLAILMPVLLVAPLGRSFIPKDVSREARLGIQILATVVLCVSFMELVARPKLRAEVEKLKNTPGQP